MRNALVCTMIAVSTLLLAEPVRAERVFQARTSENTPLSATQGVFTTVLQIAIPAGRWAINSKTQAVNFATSEIVRCTLSKGTTVLDGSGTNVGFEDGLPLVAMLINQAVTKTNTTVIIAMKCGHTEADLAGIYLDAGSSLIIEEIVP